jgi:ribose transport system permease protein
VTGALTLGALSGLGFGIFNGLLTTVGRINAFIATLASSIIIRGLALAITGGFLVSVDDPSFITLGLGEFLDVRYPVYAWLGFALFCGFLLWRTRFGRYVYACGGNAEAARLSGVRVGLVRGTTFAISGLSGGLAGIILASQVGTGQAEANPGIEFDAIAAIIIGGTSILGGEGAIWRSVLGALLFQLISNGFNLMNVQTVYQRVFLGAIMLLAVALDAWARRTRTA